MKTIPSTTPPVFAREILNTGIGWTGLTVTVVIQRSSDDYYWNETSNEWQSGSQSNAASEGGLGLYRVVTDAAFFSTYFEGTVKVLWTAVESAVTVHSGAEEFVLDWPVINAPMYAPAAGLTFNNKSYTSEGIITFNNSESSSTITINGGNGYLKVHNGIYAPGGSGNTYLIIRGFSGTIAIDTASGMNTEFTVYIIGGSGELVGPTNGTIHSLNIINGLFKNTLQCTITHTDIDIVKMPATIAAGDIATDAITAAAVKADAITKIQAGVAMAAGVKGADAIKDAVDAANAYLTGTIYDKLETAEELQAYINDNVSAVDSKATDIKTNTDLLPDNFQSVADDIDAAEESIIAKLVEGHVVEEE